MPGIVIWAKEQFVCLYGRAHWWIPLTTMEVCRQCGARRRLMPGAALSPTVTTHPFKAA